MNIARKKNEIYQTISEYFGDIMMTKLKHEEKTNLSFYYAKVGSLLSVEDRYLVAIVENDKLTPTGYGVKLSTLKWKSFQTRTLSSKTKLVLQDIPLVSQMTMNISLFKTENKPDRSVFLTYDSPICVELLKETENQNHSDTGTLKLALDTFECIVYFTI